MRAATAKLDEILKKVKIPEYDQLINGVARTDIGQLKLSKDMLATLPDKLAAASAAFVTKNDGTALAAIDPLIPTEVKGSPQP